MALGEASLLAGQEETEGRKDERVPAHVVEGGEHDRGEVTSLEASAVR